MANTFTNLNGEIIDFDTGEAVGRAASAPVSKDPRATTEQNQEFTSVGDAVSGIVKQGSWGFNTGLFYLPDLVQKGLGRGMGLKDDQIFQLEKYFNRGQVAPKNTTERFARAIGEGVGSGLPFTGVVAAVAATRPMVTAAKGGAGVFKSIADDTIKFAQQNPRLAFYTDVAFNGAYEAMRQSVEETVDSSNPYKAVMKDVLPMGAFMGVPALLSALPSIKAAKWGAKKLEGMGGSGPLDEVTQEVYNDLPKALQMPGIRIAPKMVLQRAEQKLIDAMANIHGDPAKGITGDPDAQQAIQMVKDWMADPRVSQSGFVWDTAQSTMYAPLLSKRLEQLKGLTGDELAKAMERQNANEMAFFKTVDSFRPDAQMGINDAMKQIQTERQSLFDALTREQSDLTDLERMSLSDRLGPQNMDNLNGEIRGALLAKTEISQAEQQRLLKELGIRDVTAEGLPMSTRDPETNLSLTPAADIQGWIDGMAKKYKVNDPSKAVPVPSTLKRLMAWSARMSGAKEKARETFIDKFVDSNVRQQIEALGWDMDYLTKPMPTRNKAGEVTGEGPSLYELLLEEAGNAVRKEMGLELPKKANVGLTNKDGNLVFRDPQRGYQRNEGRSTEGAVVLNVKGIADDVKTEAEKYAVNMNASEALHYLNGAIQDRNYLLSFAENRMAGGKSAGRLKGGAQDYINIGNQFYNDIEQMVLETLPKIDPKVNQNFGKIREVLNKYQQDYEQLMPLMWNRREMRGGKFQFTTPNEDISRAAFNNATNLRQVVKLLGDPSVPGGQEYLKTAAIDWMARKNIFTKEGTVDPQKMLKEIEKNRSLFDVLPPEVQANFQDEVKMAEDYIKRMGQLTAREKALKNKMLDDFLEHASMEGADPRHYMSKAIQDPAFMQMLVKQAEGNPDLLAALRRGVYDIAAEGAKQGAALSGMLSKNGKSLEVLYKNDPQHLADLRTLADIQRRAMAYEEISGKLPAFEATDDAFRKNFGFGVKYLTTSWRDIQAGRQSPATGVMGLLMRAATSTEARAYDTLFAKAMEDPEFAKRIVNLKSPADGAKVRGALEKEGVSLIPFLTSARAGSRARATLAGELNEALGPELEAPVSQGMEQLPVKQPGEAARMLKSMPAAPQTRGLPQAKSRLPTQLQAMPQTPKVQPSLMYPTLFPNDPISDMLLQRQAKIQGPSQ